MNRLVIILFALCSSFSFSQKTKQFDKAVILMQKEKFQKATQLLENITEKEPQNISAFFNLGLSYFELEKTGDAIWAFEKSLRLAPSNTNVENALKLCYLKLDPQGTRNINPTSPPALARLAPNVWALMGITTSIFISVLIVVISKGNRAYLKGFLIFSTILLCGLLLFAIYGGFISQGFRNNEGKSVVTTDAIVYLKDESPSNESIQTGSVLSILDTLTQELVICTVQNNREVILDIRDLRAL